MYQPKTIKPADTVTKQGGAAILSWGLDGSGKTHLIVNSHETAPHLVLISLDRDASHLLAKYKGEDYVYEKIPLVEEKALAKAYCEKIEEVIDWAVRRKEPTVFGIDNVVNWRTLANNAYLPDDAEISQRRRPEIIPRDYDMVNGYLRRCVLKLEQSNLWTVLTAPAGPKWEGEQRKAELVKGEDALECKAWQGFDFCVVAKVYMFNASAHGLVRPVPQEEVRAPTFKAMIHTAKLAPKRQGVILDNPTLKEVWELVS